MDRNRNDEWKKSWATSPQLRVLPEQLRADRRALTMVPPAMPVARAETGVVSAQRASLGSLIVDGAGTILAFDRNMERLTGWAAHEVVGQSKELGVYAPPDENGVRGFTPRPLFIGTLPRVERSQLVRLALTRKDGAQLDAEVVVTPLGGRGHRAAIEVNRIVARFAAPSSPENTVQRDPLTQLARSAVFQARLQGSIEHARREGRSVSVLLVDVDHLDTVNDHLGRTRGDEILRHVAGIVSASIRHSDMAARLGADDFGVLLFGTGRGDARHVGGRIRAAIEAFDFNAPGEIEPFQVTASIGVSTFPADAEQPIELLRRAREALDEVRRMGRNRVWCYSRRPRVPLDVPVYFDGPAAHFLGHSRDVSNSGIFLTTQDDVPIGMRLGLNFRLPGSEDPLRVIGRVVRRADPDLMNPGIGLGIEFEHYSAEDRWRLESFLHEYR